MCICMRVSFVHGVICDTCRCIRICALHVYHCTYRYSVSCVVFCGIYLDYVYEVVRVVHVYVITC